MQKSHICFCRAHEIMFGLDRNSISFEKDITKIRSRITSVDVNLQKEMVPAVQYVDSLKIAIQRKTCNKEFIRFLNICLCVSHDEHIVRTVSRALLSVVNIEHNTSIKKKLIPGIFHHIRFFRYGIYHP